MSTTMTLNLDHLSIAVDDDGLLPPLPNFNAGKKQLSEPESDPDYQLTESVI